jgi:rubrerythrin
MRTILLPVHRWVWRDAERRVHKLLRFGETETGGGRDLVRAAELTSDPLLRRLYLVHAADELRHGEMFRRRGADLLRTLPPGSKPSFQANWLAPSGHGADDLRVDGSDDDLLAFLHLSEADAASRFAVYRDVLQDDLSTRAVFEEILHDEAFHMNYTLSQLARVSPQHHRRRLWRARFSRLWKGYLRLATALAGILGSLILTIEYFILLPPFALLAKRAAHRELPGWTPISPQRNDSLKRQY